MRSPTALLVLLLALVTVAVGCQRQKTNDELVADLKSSDDKDRVVAVRLLGQRKENAEKTIPALIDALKDHDADIRRSAAIGLGGFGEQAKDAVPALQTALKDKDARVRESAATALTRIDPAKFPPPAGSPRKGG